MAQIVKRGKGTYMIRVYLGKDPATGKMKFYNETIHGSRKDAEIRRNELLTARDQNTLVERSRMTVDEYLREWLDKAARVKLRENTFEIYEKYIKFYLKPLGKFKLSD